MTITSAETSTTPAAGTPGRTGTHGPTGRAAVKVTAYGTRSWTRTEALILESSNADAVSIRQVAQAVDRTPPSIYLHFSTKDELMQAVCQRRFDAMTERFRSAIRGVDDPVEQIRLMAHEYGEFALEHPEQYRVLFMSGILTEVHDLEGLRLDDCFGMLVASVQACLEQGLFVPGDPVLISLALWASVHGVASLLVAHDLEFPPLEVYLGQVVDQNLSGRLARDSCSGRAGAFCAFRRPPDVPMNTPCTIDSTWLTPSIDPRDPRVARRIAQTDRQGLDHARSGRGRVRSGSGEQTETRAARTAGRAGSGSRRSRTEQLNKLYRSAREIADNKGRRDVLEMVLRKTVDVDPERTFDEVVAQLEQEMKLARGITGAMRVPEVGALLNQAAVQVDHLEDRADALEANLRDVTLPDTTGSEAESTLTDALDILRRDPRRVRRGASVPGSRLGRIRLELLGIVHRRHEPRSVRSIHRHSSRRVGHPCADRVPG